MGRAVSRITISAIALAVIAIAAAGAFLLANTRPFPSQALTSAVQPATTTAKAATTTAAQLPDKVVVGLAISLNGAQAEAGADGLAGIMAAVKWVNEVYGGVHIGGRAIPLEIKHYDDQTNKELVASLIERLIVVDNVKLLLGPITSPLTFAALPVAERHGALIVVWGASSDTLTQQGYKMVVSVRIPASLYYRSVMDMVIALDPYARKVGIVYANEEFSIFVANGISNYSKDRGFTVVYFKGVPTNIQDFTPVLTELKAANPDVVLFSSTYIPLGQLFSKQMIDLKIDAKLTAVTTAGCFSPYYDTFKILAEGIVCPSQWEPVARWNPELAKQMGYEWFGPTSEEYMRYYNITGKGRSPGFYAGLGGAALLYLVKAIETAQSLDPVKVRQAFNQISGKVMTFYGPFRIDSETGTYVGGGSYLVSQWQGGKRVVVWPPEVANAKPCYPLPTWDEKARGKTCSP